MSGTMMFAITSGDREKRAEGQTSAFRRLIALQTRNPIRWPPSRTYLSVCKFSLPQQFFPTVHHLRTAQWHWIFRGL